MVMPIVNKYRSIEDAIALKFKNSQNKVIKTVRGNYNIYLEYGEAFSQSVNEGEKSTHEEQPVAFKD